MIMKMGLAAFAASVAILAASPSTAAVIENTPVGSSLTLSFFELGQSFTAVDTGLLSIGFWMRTANPGTADSAFSIRLYEGEGTGGTLLATRSGVAPLDLPTSAYGGTFLDLSFAGTSLSIGSIYTAVVSANASRLGAGLDLGGSYADGQAYITGRTDLLNNPTYQHCLTGGCDAAFRVIGDTTTAVPEPATWALMIGGFGLAGGALRGSRRTIVA